MAANPVAPDAGPRRIAMPDADVRYLDRLALPQPDAQLLQRLIDEVPWRCEEIALWGRRVPQPRLTAWYGEPAARYTYSGIELRPLPWIPILWEVKQCVEAAVGSAFNSVLINYYRDNRDSIGFHSDDEPELGKQPVIASLSLGEERTFILQHKRRKSVEPVRLPLASGSLLVMKGDTQHCWRHGIRKEDRPCGPRINLTFRTIIC